MDNGIKCPECGCHIHLEWKKKDKRKEDGLCCEMDASCEVSE